MFAIVYPYYLSCGS